MLRVTIVDDGPGVRDEPQGNGTGRIGLTNHAGPAAAALR
jgi:signal transduction histidine kinase